MAEPAVSFVIEKLGDLLIQKVVFLRGIRGQVERLRDELIRMRCFLKDADEKQDEEERIRNWVSEIRVAAYDSEDVIETYIQKLESQKRANFLKKMVRIFGKVCSLYKVGKEIESIQGRIRDIADSREKYGIKNLGEGSGRIGEVLQRLRRSSPFTGDKDVVGLEDKTRFLVSRLLQEGKKSRSVVSIIGMGGVGKTTLARKLYNHADVKAQFDCRAWVCISQNCDYKDILGSIIKQVKSPTNQLLEMLEKLKEQDLEQMLHQELEYRCYLVVLDDIWKEDAWDCLAGAFPDGSKGSRLLLTSRNQVVPLRADNRSIPYELKSLGQQDSWDLFVKKAYSDSENPRCPLELEGTGREIVKRCAGLPLAITVIGGMLGRKKKLKSEWEGVLQNITSHLSRNQTGVSTILALSYSDLPPHLKSCFLYFGFFPEDYAIQSRKLIHIWIAAGLIHQKETEDLEGLAADHLDELISRNMVQVASVSADERVKSCRIHDLLRELAITKAKEEIFLEIHGVRDTQTSANCRHRVVHCENYDFSAHSTPHLRSLLFFKLAKAAQNVNLSLKSYKLLRVLDLENMDVETLPNEVGNLSLLRYISLRSTTIKKLPKSLGQLQSLQILDVTTDTTIEVPNVIWKLENLMHLYMNNVKCSEPLKIETLRNLQTLSCIDGDHLLHNNLLFLTSLHKLGVKVGTEAELENLRNSIAKLGKLRSLCLHLTSTFSSSVELSNVLNLTKLKIKGTLAKIPSHDELPPNLSHLCLSGMDLDEDPMPILAKFEQLSVLKLKMAYSGTDMMISENSFPKLKFLGLKNLENLEEVSVGKGAMPELRSLRIIGCYRLKMLPEEVKNMAALEKLEIREVRRAFTSRLQSIDAYKVLHVPTVILKHPRIRWRSLFLQATWLRFIGAGARVNT